MEAADVLASWKRQEEQLYGGPAASERRLGVATLDQVTGKTGLELALTKVGGGAKHDNKAYQTSGGLHGMGLTCVNAVSVWLEAPPSSPEQPA